MCRVACDGVITTTWLVTSDFLVIDQNPRTDEGNLERNLVVLICFDEVALQSAKPGFNNQVPCPRATPPSRACTSLRDIRVMNGQEGKGEGAVYRRGP